MGRSERRDHKLLFFVGGLKENQKEHFFGGVCLLLPGGRVAVFCLLAFCFFERGTPTYLCLPSKSFELAQRSPQFRFLLLVFKKVIGYVFCMRKNPSTCYLIQFHTRYVSQMNIYHRHTHVRANVNAYLFLVLIDLLNIFPPKMFPASAWWRRNVLPLSVLREQGTPPKVVRSS